MVTCFSRSLPKCRWGGLQLVTSRHDISSNTSEHFTTTERFGNRESPSMLPLSYFDIDATASRCGVELDALAC